MNYKSFECGVKGIDIEAGIYELMPSMETTDRDGDVLVATGANLDSYRRNPVVLWAHSHDSLPVAKALNVEAVPGVGLRATIQFPPKGVDEFADRVHAMWKAGFLNAASVGFIPKAGIPNEKRGTRFTEWEMLEFSIVPVPANADALRLAVKAVEDSAPIEKRGRVLSAANERKLRDAAEAISAVLAQLEGPEVDEGKATEGELPGEVIDSLRAAIKGI